MAHPWTVGVGRVAIEELVPPAHEERIRLVGLGEKLVGRYPHAKWKWRGSEPTPFEREGVGAFSGQPLFQLPAVTVRRPYRCWRESFAVLFEPTPSLACPYPSASR